MLYLMTLQCKLHYLSKHCFGGHGRVQLGTRSDLSQPQGLKLRLAFCKPWRGDGRYGGTNFTLFNDLLEFVQDFEVHEAFLSNHAIILILAIIRVSHLQAENILIMHQSRCKQESSGDV